MSSDLFGTGMTRTAEISDCGRYRYSLGRAWSHAIRHMTIVMLNPSTADADVDDPTIRRCIGFAKREGCGGLTVVNLFGLRSSSPKDLKLADDPVGPNNMAALFQHVADASIVVCGWGAHPIACAPAARFQSFIETQSTIRLWCLGTTQDGAPRHPLYVRASKCLERL